MWSLEDVSPEQLAKLLHHYRGALAKDSLSHCGEDCTSFWERSSQSERELMISAAGLAPLEPATQAAPSPSRKYFANPGEADWGC